MAFPPRKLSLKFIFVPAFKSPENCALVSFETLNLPWIELRTSGCKIRLKIYGALFIGWDNLFFTLALNPGASCPELPVLLSPGTKQAEARTDTSVMP